MLFLDTCIGLEQINERHKGSSRSLTRELREKEINWDEVKAIFSEMVRALSDFKEYFVEVAKSKSGIEITTDIFLDMVDRHSSCLTECISLLIGEYNR